MILAGLSLVSLQVLVVLGVAVHVAWLRLSRHFASRLQLMLVSLAVDDLRRVLGNVRHFRIDWTSRDVQSPHVLQIYVRLLHNMIVLLLGFGVVPYSGRLHKFIDHVLLLRLVDAVLGILCRRLVFPVSQNQRVFVESRINEFLVKNLHFSCFPNQTQLSRACLMIFTCLPLIWLLCLIT